MGEQGQAVDLRGQGTSDKSNAPATLVTELGRVNSGVTARRRNLALVQGYQRFHFQEGQTRLQLEKLPVAEGRLLKLSYTRSKGKQSEYACIRLQAES